MEYLLVWILIFAGATIGLLATFLIASERQLQKAEEQEASSKAQENPRAANVAAYATPRGQEFPSDERNDDLPREVAKLNAELDSSRATVTELQEWLVHSQRRQEHLTDRANRLEAEINHLKCQSQLIGAAQADSSDPQAALETEKHQKLTGEVAHLQQQLADDAAQIKRLENARQELADVNREVHEDNLHLRSQIAALRQQLDDGSYERERRQETHRLLSAIVAKQAASVENMQEVQHKLLQLSDWLLADAATRHSGNNPATAKAAAAANNDAVELTEREVFLSAPPPDQPQSQPLRRRFDRRAEMASSALAITVFLVAIGILASQIWRLTPAERSAANSSAATIKPLHAADAGSAESAPAVPQKKQIVQVTASGAEDRVADQPETK